MTRYQLTHATRKSPRRKKARWNPDTIKAFGSAYIAACRNVNDALAGKLSTEETAAALRVSISNKNNKMGPVPSVSLVPGMTCREICKDQCGIHCYSFGDCILHKNVLQAYARNTALATLAPDLYWKQVDAAACMARWFRFHVGGDIPTAGYFERLIACVKNNPGTTFLLFTKRYEIVNAWIETNGPLPSNLRLLFSGWFGMKPDNPHGLPETNVYTEDPEPEWLICGNDCSECACRGCGCWKAEPGETIAFKLH